MMELCAVAQAERAYQASLIEDIPPTCSLCGGEIKGEWVTDNGSAYFDVASYDDTAAQADGDYTHTVCVADGAVAKMDAEDRESLARVYALCVALSNELDAKTILAIESAFPSTQVQALEELSSALRQALEAGRDDEPAWVAGAVRDGQARQEAQTAAIRLRFALSRTRPQAEVAHA